jgi:hypothetical protein
MYDKNDSPDDGLMNSLNIIKKNVPGISPKVYGEIQKQMSSALSFKGKPEFKTIDLPVGKTLRYYGTMALKQSDTEEVVMEVAGYMFCKGDSFYVLTLSAGEGQLKGKKETYEKIAKSIKFE